ncbi:hypothetical protein ACTJJ0_29995 [Chitinophaga sp. 22321]|uniref:GLPGLI family protein n=1 Tax=Chitinophaga hostae TaxID=2831022 RepID=A0ABS5J9H2_9BACT|nr:hypothetical protein [Chitinophaga hostae]MBS0031232.1 hypothetical protein [Chitinophaga hostae]
MRKHLFVITCLQLSILTVVFGQSPAEALKKKNVSDTILQNRSLLLQGTFDAQRALLQLFPGKHYRLTDGKNVNEMINWECKSCAAKNYPDVNEDALGAFPYKDGVATRLINVMDFKDSTGQQYKVISFNHSGFDEDGTQTSRFTGGLLGLAKFVLTDNGWNLRMFQPAISAYGAFSQCPTPKPLLIGKDQYAFVIKHSNGGGGGPFDGNYYLVAGVNGGYQQVMAAYGIERTVGGDEEQSSWQSTYTVPASDKKYFRDILVTLKGTVNAKDLDGLPNEVKNLVKGKKQAHFTAEERYVYKGAAKGYELQLPVKAALVP